MTIGDPVPRAEIPALFATHDALVNNMRAGAPDKVVYEAAAACLPGARLQSDLRRAPRAGAAVHALGSGRARRPDPHARRDEPGGEGGAGRRPSRASGGESLGAVVGAWHPRRRGDRRDGRRRTPHPEGRGHLRLGGAPAAAPARPARARLGHPLPHAPRGRARRVGVRATSSARAASRSTTSAFERTSIPSRSARSPPTSAVFGPASCTRISSTRTSTGSSPGSMTRVPLRLSTKHGFNEFREGRWFGVRRPLRRLARARPHRDLAGARAVPRRDRGLRRAGLRDRPLRDRRGRGLPSRIAGSEPRLVCIGRLIPIKGHLVLLRALAQARARVPNVSLDVAGRGPLAPALKAYARELGLEDAVRFLGFVVARGGGDRGRGDRGRARRSARDSGWWRSRRWSGRGRSSRARSGGLPEIVADGETGLVVPAADAEALAEAIVALAGDLARAAAMGAAGRARALEEFTPERCVERVEALYERALRADVGRAPALHALPELRRARRRRGARGGSPTAPGSAPIRRRPSRRACCRRA